MRFVVALFFLFWVGLFKDRDKFLVVVLSDFYSFGLDLKAVTVRSAGGVSTNGIHVSRYYVDDFNDLKYLSLI